MSQSKWITIKENQPMSQIFPHYFVIDFTNYNILTIFCDFPAFKKKSTFNTPEKEIAQNQYHIT